jgi:hypothetical protein
VNQTSLPPSAGLPLDTKIGIGIGVPLGALVLGGLGVTIWYLRRRLNASDRHRQQDTTARGGAGADTISPPMYQHRQRYGGGWKSERSELEGTASPVVVELPAGA